MNENKFCDGNCPCNSAPKVEKEKELLYDLKCLFDKMNSAINFITARDEHLRNTGFIELGLCSANLKYLIDVKYKLDFTSEINHF